MSDAFRPITSSRPLQTPQGYRIYTTQRDVPMEFPLPAIGDLISAANFIGGFSNHFVMDVSDAPRGDSKRVTVTHGPVPAGAFTEYESVPYTFPPIYPNATAFFPGGSKARSRVVIGRIVYEFRQTPGNWTSLAPIWNYTSLATGPFEVKSYLAEDYGTNFIDEDGESGLVGHYMNNSFVSDNTINDAWYVYAPGSLFYQGAPSAPSATIYAGWVAGGTELMARRTLHKWYCFYMLRTVWVKAQ
jgi:hypothetical protein